MHIYSDLVTGLMCKLNYSHLCVKFLIQTLYFAFMNDCVKVFIEGIILTIYNKVRGDGQFVPHCGGMLSILWSPCLRLFSININIQVV